MDSCLKDNLLICNLFGIIQSGTNRGCYIPENILNDILSKTTEFWRHTSYVKEIYKLLSLDLKFRPAGISKHNSTEETMIVTIYELKQKATNDSLLFLSSSSDFILLQLKFHYLVQVLLAIQDQKKSNCNENHQTTFHFIKLLKRTTLTHIISLLSIINEHISESLSVQSITELYEDLQTVICLPFEHCINSVIKVELDEIVFCLVEELIHMKITKLKMSLLQVLPSHLLVEKTIDLLLEKEFCFHSSADDFSNTILYQNSESSLSKFCCVHLCRVPYKLNGEFGNSVYFLFLLCSLFKELLLRETNEFLSMSYSNDDVREDAVLKFQGIVNSVQSHIPHFIDRLMEDEMVMNELVQQKCWMYLQLLNAMTNTVQISTAVL